MRVLAPSSLSTWRERRPFAGRRKKAFRRVRIQVLLPYREVLDDDLATMLMTIMDSSMMMDRLKEVCGKSRHFSRPLTMVCFGDLV